MQTWYLVLWFSVSKRSKLSRKYFGFCTHCSKIKFKCRFWRSFWNTFCVRAIFMFSSKTCSLVLRLFCRYMLAYTQLIKPAYTPKHIHHKVRITEQISCWVLPPPTSSGSHDPTPSSRDLPSMYNTFSSVLSCTVLILLTVYIHEWTTGQENRFLSSVQAPVLCFSVLLIFNAQRSSLRLWWATVCKALGTLEGWPDWLCT